MQIHPQPFGQVLGETMSTLGRTWRRLVPPALLAFIPAGILTFFAYRLTGGQEVLELILTDPEAIHPEQMWTQLRPLLEATAYALIITVVATVYVYLASHHITAADVAGEPVTSFQARRHAGRRWISGLIALFLALLAVAALLAVGAVAWMLAVALIGPGIGGVFIATVLLLVLITPAIWLSVGFSMATAVISVEEAGPLRALQRSLLLVRGRWLPTLGYLLLVGLLGSVAIQLIQMVAIPLTNITPELPGIQLAALIGIIVQGMIVAAIATMYTGWYIDLRARKETLLSEALLSRT